MQFEAATEKHQRHSVQLFDKCEMLYAKRQSDFPEQMAASKIAQATWHGKIAQAYFADSLDGNDEQPAEENVE